MLDMPFTFVELVIFVLSGFLEFEAVQMHGRPYHPQSQGRVERYVLHDLTTRCHSICVRMHVHVSVHASVFIRIHIPNHGSTHTGYGRPSSQIASLNINEYEYGLQVSVSLERL